jgi:predicted nucleotidyltransferase
METMDYRSIWEERKAEEKRKRALAIRKAKGVAKVLKKKYHAREVILFGSLIWRPEFFWRGTDIDLLVKGIDDERYFEILADVSSIAHPFHVDLVPYEKARPLIKKRARKEGVGLE